MFQGQQHFRVPHGLLRAVVFSIPFFFSGAGNAQGVAAPPAVAVDDSDDEPDAPRLPSPPPQEKFVPPAPPVAPIDPASAAASSPAEKQAKSPVFISAAKSADSSFSGLSWSLPPTPWRAQLLLSGYGNFPSQFGSSLSFSETFSAMADSYVWQPWFLRLNGSMALSQIDTEGDGASTRSNALNIGVSGNLLPNTRNPLAISTAIGTNKSIARTDSGNTSRSESQTTSLGLTKVFVPLDRSFTSSWNYNLMNTDGGTESPGSTQGGFRSTTQGLSVNVTVPIATEDPQSLNFNTNIFSTKTSDQVSAQVGHLDGAHSIYLQDYVMTIGTSLLLDSSSVAKDGQESKNSVVNLFSSMDWVPSDDYPLTVGGGLGAFNSATETQGDKYSVTNVNGRMYARYPMDKHWTFDGRLDALQLTTQLPAGSFSTSTVGLSGGASWAGDGLRAKWGEWGYANGYGSSASYFYTSSTFDAGSNTTSAMGVDARFNQGVNRVFSTASGAPVTMSVDEGYSARVQGGVGGGVTQALNHGLSLSWAPSTNFVTKQFSATVNDGRSWGTTTDVYQSLSGDASVQYFASAYSTLGGSARLMFTRQSGTFGGRQMATGNAGARYTHARFAGVSGLNYVARYDVFIRDDPGQESRSSGLEQGLSQTWSWRYGLLGWQVDYTISKFGPALDQTVTLSVVRDFSGVL